MQTSELWHNKWNHCINEVLCLRFFMFTNLDNLRLLFFLQGQNSVHLCCFTRPCHIKAFHTKHIYMCVGLKMWCLNFINTASYIFVNTRFISSTDLIIMRVFFSIKYCQVIEYVKIFFDMTHPDLHNVFIMVVIISSVELTCNVSWKRLSSPK